MLKLRPLTNLKLGSQVPGGNKNKPWPREAKVLTPVYRQTDRIGCWFVPFVISTTTYNVILYMNFQQQLSALNMLSTYYIPSKAAICTRLNQ
jgi:hypothetical protein